jgi:3'-phosphoadenosine 5'-phosphosulfate sulfotransferase (PAPS reductase)/FAD synthetase
MPAPLIASLSGGKDSTAMALWLKRKGIKFKAIFLDTGWEAPETIAYLGELAEKLGQRIVKLRGPHTFESLVVRKGAFPHRKMRFCTQELKVKPFLEWVHKTHGATEIVNAVGIRAEESTRRAQLSCIEPMAETLGSIIVWRPLLRWTEQDVIDEHTRAGFPPNPLYLQGHRRVGCWPCIAGSKASLRNLPEHRIKRIEALEACAVEVSAAAGSRKHANPPTMFTVRYPGAGGKHTSVPIRETIAWAKTARGGKQMELDSAEEPGCMRWGLCDAEPMLDARQGDDDDDNDR